MLEIGVGIGADHQRFAQAGARLTGIDITKHAIDLVRRRFELLKLNSRLMVSDAESLPFPDGSFDLVYSWGVIHHTPDTAAAAREILRVLKPGGEFRVMVYNRHSLIGLMLYLRYGYRCGFSLDRFSQDISRVRGTKAYTRAGAAALFAGARNLRTDIALTHGDLLDSDAGQRHRGTLLTVARALWPRRFLKRFAKGLGLFLMVSGRRA